MAAVLAEIADILIAVAAITVPVANVSTQVLLVPASLADILAAIFSGGVVTDVTRVPPQIATILTNVSVVAAKLARVLMDVTPVRAKIVRFAMRHAWVKGRVQVVGTLCAYELRTSNKQGCGNGSHSEIAHGFSQRQYRALAVMACAACTTVARWPTLSASGELISGGTFFRSIFPDSIVPFSDGVTAITAVRLEQHVDRDVVRSEINTHAHRSQHRSRISQRAICLNQIALLFQSVCVRRCCPRVCR